VEKIIFILLPIAYFLYNAYLNFKKEQEKALKRNEEQSHTPATEINTKNNERIPKYYQDSIRMENKEYESDIRKYLSTNKLERDHINKAAKDVNKTNKSSVKDYYNPETPVEEVLQNRTIHQNHPHQFDFPSQFKDELIDFDLRRAIIYEVILKRPNY
jgi:hypothetical protein